MASHSATMYQIIDEPRPGALTRLAVNPFWPLLGFMFGGAFFSWVWSLINSLALGSPTRLRELFAILCGFVGYFLLLFAMSFLINLQVFEGLTHQYTRILLVGFSLIPSYYVYLRQSAAYELFEYFGGKALNGIPILLAGYFVGSKFQLAVLTAVINGVSLWTR
ncbi:hypothetical protein [uncultured Microbulbifer sp.]|uniref:hypothetical protein n=1 Tax=uncultured Microbulbifer sp. TaxID=348147 RepID=UPI0025E080C2|nr:hypothetical protein [uncultured Microbulbifer sp.]